jgi:RNA:NAD 2'-phosphotransferase (TPT1/KptA family)
VASPQSAHASEVWIRAGRGHSHRDLYEVIELVDGGDEQMHGTVHVQLAKVFALLRNRIAFS